MVGYSGYQKQRKRDGEKGIPTEHTMYRGASEIGGLDLLWQDYWKQGYVILPGTGKANGAAAAISVFWRKDIMLEGLPPFSSFL